MAGRVGLLRDGEGGVGAETDGEDAWGRGAGEACRWEGGMRLEGR